MLRIGHMGLTAGLSSAGIALWIRKRVRKHIQASGAVDSLSQRIRNRGRFVLAGLAFSGCATVVSGTIDSFERLLGFTHRTGGHAPPLLSGVYLAARLAKRAGAKAAQWVCDRIGFNGDLDHVVEELEELSSWILNGGLVGAVTHILGDLPTMGTGGTALQLLYPISKKAFNLGLISAASETLNTLALKAGAILAAVSWAVSGAHLFSPGLPEKTVGKLIKRVANQGKNIDVSQLRAQAIEFVQQIEARLKAAVGTAKGIFGRTMHRISQLKFTFGDFFGITDDFDSGIDPI